MNVVVVPGADGGGLLRPGGRGAVAVTDLAAAVRELEAGGGAGPERDEADGGANGGVSSGANGAGPPRWVWADTGEVYPALLARGVRLSRCHDLALTEGLLLAYEGRYGEPRSARAAYARLHGLPVPQDHHAPEARQATLFEEEPDPLGAEQAGEVHADQLRRIGALPDPHRFRLLVAAESAGALIAAEMGHDGMPWRRAEHDALLAEMLGPRPVHGMRPAKLQALADQVAAAFGTAFNPDSSQQIIKAFKSAGLTLSSTRAHELRRLDHPGVAPLLAYKELARFHSFHGWAWADQWVRDDRFRPEFVVAGVVTGRWATSGGGALQIHRAMRRAVVADEGWTLVVADAAQLEPRVLAAMAGDGGLARAAGQADLYRALAQAFGGERDHAKIAMLSAMYGGTSGDAPKLLAVMRQRFPAAYRFVEDAARAGEEGKLVRSWLGRTCPPPSARWRELVSGPEGGRAARDRGRFTRNFVVQATAAEWALALMAVLRGLLPDPARLVFFQHDEVMVHCPAEQADEVVAAVGRAAEEASRLLFGPTPVRFPMETAVVRCYADAK
ncbi:bifunctional 3'-5' exonuclease/DNA polymerase [Planomonospora sp. ID67723]|uniref:bifunctional 3'-5' exonuclease/DNA polymerase n=1 Tax=Planomonospora sp. ID67723 TaxID=2738134 RepID=UPI0018C3AB3C|nr:bifunctional 3'-5' exonuclease/DNA polymerase [Planomonospora sp. ID67723]MBG0830885.1 bifunctional 3'-5' exonuclease/DNA polymerase [Planomonospora sp. ID67723]